MDRESVDNLLETIDGALHGDTSMDAMRWVPEDDRTDDTLTRGGVRQVLPISLAISVDSSALEDALRRVVASLNAALPNIQRSMAEIGAAAARAINDSRTVVGEAIFDETNPRERALHLRRTRNTGPRPSRRAPRSIDPHGHR